MLSKFESALWHFHIPVSAETAAEYIDGNDRRVVCSLYGTETFQCALMPDGKGHFFINVNKKIRDKLRLKEGDEVSFTLEKDHSEYGLPMPEEMAELMKMDTEGSDLFHALTPGKQRTLLYMAGFPKSTDIRIRRSICILDHLKATRGKVNYKQLNELIKQSK